MMLEARNIRFRYGVREPEVLSGFSFQMAQTDRLGLFAPSGHGKTTLGLLLAGHLLPAQGEILLGGKPLPRKGSCPVQLIGQHPEKAVNPRWRMAKVLEEAGQLRTEVLEELGIEKSWLSRFPAELSGGELQRFCIARALCAETRFLIADEISTMLDAITQAQVWQYILKEAQKREIGLLAISHSRPLLERVTAKILTGL